MTTNDDTAAALAASDTHDDEDMWVSPPFESSSPFQNNLRDFESLLRCTICRGILDKAVSLKACSHSFCSLCIRRSIRDAALQGNRKPPTCPVCKEEVDKNTKLSIMPNRSLQMLAAQFQTMRGDLRDRLLGVVSNYDTEHNAEESNSSQSEGETVPRRSPRTLRSSDDEEEPAQPPAANLEAATAPTAVLSSQERLPPRASLPYGTMKKKKLQELCEKDGLSTKGDEAALKKRHLEFMLLYHAECDSFLPQRTPQELAREIMDQEKKKLQEQHAARMSGVATHGVLVKRIGDSTHKSDDEGGTSSAASSGNVKFDSKWNEGFAMLIGESLARNKMTTEDLQRKRKKWTEEDLDKSVVGFKPVFEDQKPAARALSRNSGSTTQSTLAAAFGFSSAPQLQTTATASYEQKPPPLDSAPTAHHASSVAAWSGTAGESAARAPAGFSLSQPPSQMSQSSNHLPTPTSARSRNPYMPAASASSSAFASQDSSAVSVDSTPSPHNPPSSAAAARPILDRGQQTLHASVPPLNPYAQSSGRKRKAPASTGPWTCSNCTFRNEKRNYANARCEMCEVSRNEHEQPDVPAEKQEEATSSNGEVAICIDC